MLIPLLGDTSGARAYEHACERRARRGRGLRGVIEDVGHERFEKELPRGQPFDEATVCGGRGPSAMHVESWDPVSSGRAARQRWVIKTGRTLRTCDVATACEC